jgi:hypothetical protein
MTTIQSWLARNELALRPLSAFACPQHHAHRLAVEAITSPARREEQDIHKIMASPLEQAQTLLRQAAASGIRFILISSQYFCIGDPSLVREQFRALGIDQVTIVFVLRRQDRFVEFEYAQAVNMLGRVDPIPKPTYRKDLDWFELLSPWAQIFGIENIVLHSYDPIIESGKSLPFVLLEASDKDIAALAAQESALNESSPAALLEFQRLANSVGVTGALPLVEDAKRRGLGGPPFRLDPLKARQLLDLYRESNCRVARQFLGRDNLFDEGDLENGSEGADYTGALPLEWLAKLLALHLSRGEK